MIRESYLAHCLGFSVRERRISPNILAEEICMRSAFGLECMILACPLGSVSRMSGRGEVAARKDFPAPESPYISAFILVVLV